MWQRYGAYLAGLKDEAHRDHVFAYMAKEDTPRPLPYQTNLLRSVGSAARSKSCTRMAASPPSAGDQVLERQKRQALSQKPGA